MKIKSHFEGLAVAVICAAVLAKDTLVKLTGNKTVDKAGADAIVIGTLKKPAREANGTGTVETFFKALVTVKTSGALVAGDRVKMAAADGDGNQRVTKWISQTDAAAGDKPDSLIGVCFVGGADAADVQVLLY